QTPAPAAPQAISYAHIIPDRPRGRLLLGSIAALAVVAGAVSVYLLWLSLNAMAPAGCGPSSGCEEVLASRWSRWFGVPVSGLAVATYLGIAGVAGLLLRWSPARRPLLAAALLGLGLAAGGAAGWFTYLQFGRLGQLCQYCIGVHACGL